MAILPLHRYRQDLEGEAILLEARVTAAADVIKAMASHRPYLIALGIESALAEIDRGRASAYDAVVAYGCVKVFREQGNTISA